MFKKLRNKAVISFCIFLLLVVGGTSLTYYLFAEDLYVAKKKKVMNEAFQALQTMEMEDKLLAEHVIIKYADAGSERAVYQYSGEMGHCVQHLHLKCVKCGRILHLDCGFMDEFRNHLKEDHKFRLLCEGDLLHGICGDCEKKMEDK